MSRTRPTKKGSKPDPCDDEAENDPRTRILNAAFTAFMENGYAAASTLEIATRARVSKRELYALFGSKQQMLIACIEGRSRRLEMPADVPTPRDRAGLSRILTAFGAQVLGEVTDPTIIGMFRLAIAEAVNAPEVAQALDSIGRETTRVAVRKIMTEAKAAGLIEGKIAEQMELFGALLFGDVLMSLLLGIASQPTPREIAARARDATDAFLRLYPAST